MDVERKIFLWVMVTRLPKGKMYAGGTIDNFQNLTVWRGGRVMAEVTFLHGWHTVLLNMELDISKIHRSVQVGGQLAAGPHGSR